MSATVGLPPLGPAPCSAPVGKAVEEDKTPRDWFPGGCDSL